MFFSGSILRAPVMIADRVVHRVGFRIDDAEAAAEPLDVDPVGDLEHVGHVVADQDDAQPLVAQVA